MAKIRCLDCNSEASAKVLLCISSLFFNKHIKTWPNISVDHKNIKQPPKISNRPVITTLGSIDQAGYNRLKALVKTGSGFDCPTLWSSDFA